MWEGGDGLECTLSADSDSYLQSLLTAGKARAMNTPAINKRGVCALSLFHSHNLYAAPSLQDTS